MQEEAGFLGYKTNPYDALLDNYEPGLKADFCRNLFDKLTPELTEVTKVLEGKKFKKLIGTFPIEKQKDLANEVLKKMGYDANAGRIDTAPHPFETNLGHFDVRITNRYDAKDFRSSLTGAMHEGGHALYEQNVRESYEFTPLDHGTSLGIHESQSRFWENMVGRSREFQEFMSPIYKKYYPNLKSLTQNDFFEIMNVVAPSLIRVEADEVTYNLHIALRFEIEDGLMNNKIKVKDLPEVWNTKMKKYLGIVPKTNTNGVMQDIHWAQGSFGYFPTYTLGNLYSAQWRHYMKKDLNLEKQIKLGNFRPILDWFQTNIHAFGKLYTPDELVKKVTGESLNPNYFLLYLKEKYVK